MLSSISLVRRKIQTGLPRHSTVIRCPGSSLDIFAFTGAPAALALALGFHDATNGTAAPITPTPPTTEVAPTRNRRRPVFTSPSLIETSPPIFVQTEYAAE